MLGGGTGEVPVLHQAPCTGGLVHDFEDRAGAFGSSGLGCAIEVSGGVEDEVAGGMVAVGAVSEDVDYFVGPASGGDGRKSKEGAASAAAVVGGSAISCSVSPTCQPETRASTRQSGVSHAGQSWPRSASRQSMLVRSMIATAPESAALVPLNGTNRRCADAVIAARPMVGDRVKSAPAGWGAPFANAVRSTGCNA